MISFTQPKSEILYSRLCDQVAARIQEMILTGQMHPGERLPTESELVRAFGVSRTTIREAVKLLKERGLVEVLQGKGVFVTRPSMDTVSTSMGRLFAMSSDSARHVTEIRRVLEVAIAPLAALRATERDIEKLEKAIMEMDAALEDATRYVEEDLNFHLALAGATQNSLFITLINPIIGALTEQRLRTVRVPGSPEQGQNWHRRILKCVKERKPEQARLAMKNHLEQAEADLRLSMGIVPGQDDDCPDASKVDEHRGAGGGAGAGL